MTRVLHRLGQRCAARPLLVIGIWLVVVGAVTGLSLAAGGRYATHDRLPGTEVQHGQDVLARAFPAAAAETADVVVHASAPDRLADVVAAVTSQVTALPHVAAVTTQPADVSADGTTRRLRVTYDRDRFGLPGNALSRLHSALKAAIAGDHAPGAAAYPAGLLVVDFAQPRSGLGEKVGIGAAMLVLLVAFGSVSAALMPIATAALGIVTGLGLVKLLAAVYAVNDSAPALATMIGLGVGIDYALFIVTRHRERLRAGDEPHDAAVLATATAGTSVLWAGVTVVAAICGLAFAGIPVMSSLGFAAAIVVATSMTASLTVLPALLALTDRHIDRLHIRLPRLHSADDGTWWTRWGRAIERHPVRYAAASAGLLVLLALPVAGIRLGMPDGSSAAHGSEAQLAYSLMAREFGAGANGPLQLVVVSQDGRALSASDGVLLRQAVDTDRDVASSGPMTIGPDGMVGVVTVVPRTGPQASATAALVPRLRSHILPPVAAATRVHVYVVGLPAGRYDVSQRVLERLPYFVSAVLAVSFVLLMLVFRSVLVPLKAVLFNLLSIAAALGVVVMVFTWGSLHVLVGVSEQVPLVDVIPMLMFAIVFGLSMDYEVFLLSRVREEWLRDGDGKDSVVRGLASTARVISAAAAIMVSVFLSFTLSGDVVVKMMGVGLAVAVLLDATVIRLVLVPATMSLLGELNWWLPRRFTRDTPVRKPTSRSLDPLRTSLPSPMPPERVDAARETTSTSR
jgi:putative drug exporter of the RND superfamily